MGLQWRGECEDRETREELVRYLWELAILSAYERIRSPKDPHPAPLIAHWSGMPICPFDREISGRILVDCEILGGPENCNDALQGANLERIDFELGSGVSRDRIHLFVVPKVVVHGLDFAIHDPVSPSSPFGRMSFVFLSSLEVPFLRGRLVRLQREADWALLARIFGGDEGSLPRGDWYISPPHFGSDSSHYLSAWSRFLLAWAKYFFIQDLVLFSDWGTVSLSKAEARIHALCGEYGREFTKRGMWDYLMESFEAEIEVWTPPH